MTGTTLDYSKHCKLPFGTYAQTHEEHSPTNLQAAQSVGAICLGLTGNLQGSHKFLKLCSGKRITHQSWTKLPMPQEVIDCVSQLGKANDQVELFTFFDCKGNPISDSSQIPEDITGVDPQTPDDFSEQPEAIDEVQQPELQDDLPVEDHSTFMFFHHVDSTQLHRFIMPPHTFEFQLVKKILSQCAHEDEKDTHVPPFEMSLCMTQQC